MAKKHSPQKSAEKTSKSSGPFGEMAQTLSTLGLIAIPANGKVPLVKWKNQKWPLKGAYLSRLIQLHGHQNIGILTGAMGLVVVDIDDPALFEPMLERFGETPLITKTPRGGYHLWYQGNGCKSTNLRSLENLNVDIKAEGGFVIVPPSRARTPERVSKTYKFFRGSWKDISNLPTINVDSPRCSNKVTNKAKSKTDIPAAEPEETAIGERNNTLFAKLREEAVITDSFEELHEKAININCGFATLLDPKEVRKTAESVWNYKINGTLFPKGQQTIPLYPSEIQLLGDNTEAFMLLAKLREAHWGRGEFIISPTRMAEEGVIRGWNKKRFTKARDGLLDVGLITEKRRKKNGCRETIFYEFGKG